MQKRRQFIQTLIRGGIFASLTLLGGVLTLRRTGAKDCVENYSCGHCKSSNSCILPEADKYRLEKAKCRKTNEANGRTGK